MPRKTVKQILIIFYKDFLNPRDVCIIFKKLVVPSDFIDVHVINFSEHPGIYIPVL